MKIKIVLIVVLLGATMIGATTYLIKFLIDDRIEAEVIATAEKTRADLAEAGLRRLEADLEAQHERQLELVRRLQEARDIEAQATEVLEDRDRLNRLTQAKPGLIERQARRATTRTWKDVEAVSRE